MSPYNTFTILCTATTPEGVITPKAFEWRRRVGANKEGTFLEVTDIGDAVLIENSNLDQPTSTSQLRVTENTPEVYEYRCRVSLTELNIMRGISSRFQIEVTGTYYNLKDHFLVHTYTPCSIQDSDCIHIMARL